MENFNLCLESLRKVLNDNKISEDSYCLEQEKYNSLCMEYITVSGTVRVFFSDKNVQKNIKIFDSYKEACKYMIEQLSNGNLQLRNMMTYQFETYLNNLIADNNKEKERLQNKSDFNKLNKCILSNDKTYRLINNNYDSNSVMMFYTKDEYNEYFNKNDVYDMDVINSCILVERDGAVFANKKLCDDTITKQHLIEAKKEFSKELIDSIHEKGNITRHEKVNELNDQDFCPSKNGDTSFCQLFDNNCEDCIYYTLSFAKSYIPGKGNLNDCSAETKPRGRK